MIIGWMHVIFNFSAQNGTNSHAASDQVVNYLQKIVYIMTGKDISVKFAVGTAYRQYLEFAVRKCAHMFIYFILSINVMLFLFTFQKMNMFLRLLISLLTCFLYACTDEFHQLFVSGRGSSFRDVLIDTSGAFFGLIASLLIFCVIYTIYHRHLDHKMERYNRKIQQDV
jgi:VanZ family protein